MSETAVHRFEHALRRALHCLERELPDGDDPAFRGELVIVAQATILAAVAASETDRPGRGCTAAMNIALLMKNGPYDA